MNPMSPSVRVEWVPQNGLHHLQCSECSSDTCVHIYDFVTTPLNSDQAIPLGSIELPMSGEFPVSTQLGVLTEERMGNFVVYVSGTMNSYGTRSVDLVGQQGVLHFVMTFNPEDAITSIYTTLFEFINTQVTYKPNDRFGTCMSPNHSINRQKELDKLKPLLGAYPMMKTWDLLSKLISNSCIVCMWRRSAPVPTFDASTSGLAGI
jgi:hypothetical protein